MVSEDIIDNPVMSFYSGRCRLRMVSESLVESQHGGRRKVLQYIKMLSVIALPIAAVIGLVGNTLYNSSVERESHIAAVEQFRAFAEIEALVTSIRAERGYRERVSRV